MTALVTTLHGDDAGRYYIDGPRGYYLDGDEPPGLWRGLGAVALGLEGEIVEEEFLAIMDGQDPTGTRLLGTAHNGRTVRGFDVTCSAPKSLSVLYALGDVDLQAELLAAHDAAVDSVLDWIDGHAHCRYRVNGQVRTFDAEGITAALFRQHTSRALDPQVHTHVVVANRVLSPDGRWLALDARTLKHDQRTLSALYHAGLRAELTGRLGLRWHEPENGIAEIADIDPAVLREMSSRTKAVEERIDVKLDRFAEYFGRLPTPRERWKLEREAVLDSRPPKAKGTNADELRADWRERIAALGAHPDAVVSGAVGRAEMKLDLASDQEVIEKALAALTERQSTWRPAEITRELAAALPTTTHRSASEIHEQVEELRQQVEDAHLVDLTRPVPEGVPRRRDGRPITESAIDRILTTPAILAQEERLMTLAQQRIDAAAALQDRPIEGADELTAVQREVAAGVAGERQLVLVVGPAGTGKTSALRPAVNHLRQAGRAVLGVAPSATAAEVLAVDAGIDADTLDKLLIEHRIDRPPEHRFDLPAGATIIVDEAAMVSTPKLAQLFDLAEQRRWRLALVGDPLQFAAVGRSGMFGHLVDTFGAIELDRVHRFAADWERAASLRLRHGDTTVVDLYEQHHRLHGGTATHMRRAVVDAWWQATEVGEKAAMMAPTREAVTALNLAAQLRRLGAGELNRAGPTLDLPDQRLYVGDVVATRRNERQLRTDQKRMVKNRDRWTVDTIHPDRSLTVSGRTGTAHLPAEYVADHVELAYAETSLANQGRTVDRSFLYLDGPTDARGIYVALTRGRATNEAFVVLRGEETPADVIAEALTRSWADEPAIVHLAASRQESDGAERWNSLMLDGPTLRSLKERDLELTRTLDPWDRQFAERSLDAARLAANSAATAIRKAEDRAAHHQAELDRFDGRPLAKRLHRDEIATVTARLAVAVADADRGQRELVDRRSAVRSFEERIRELTLTPVERKELERQHREVQRQLGLDLDARGGAALAGEADEVVLARLGPVPLDETGREMWKDTAGRIEQHRAAYDVPADTTFGPKPPNGRVDAFAMSHRAMFDAIARPDRAMNAERGLGRDAPGLSL